MLLRLRAPVLARGARQHERAAEVHADDVVPFVVGEVEHHARTAEAGVVHDDVEPAPRVDRERNECVADCGVADVAAVRDRFATRGHDLGDHIRGRILVGGAAVGRDAGVVHDHPGAVRRQAQRVRTPDPAAGAGDDGDSLPRSTMPGS